MRGIIIASLGQGTLLAAACGQMCGDPWSRWIGSPQPVGQAMAFDSARQRVVMFGGPGYTNTTWEWDALGGGGAGSWTPRAIAGPSGREYAVLAYDSVRGRVVMFGGRTSVALSGETWEWDGISPAWVLRSTTGPSPRYDTRMAFDAGRGKTVLFGNNLSNNPGTFDTWEWDGSVWALLSNGAPRVYQPAMTDSAASSRVTIIGQELNSIGTTLDWGVWEWNGATWARTGTGGLPTGFSGKAAFDPVRGKTLLIGRSSYFQPAPLEFWQWDGAAWSLLQSRTDQPAPACCLLYMTTIAYDGTGIVLIGTDISGVPQTWRLASALVGGPIFTHVPLSTIQYVEPGAAVVLSAQTAAPATFRWSFNGVPLNDGGHISGAFTLTLTITPSSGIDTGGYAVAATDSCGTKRYGPVAVSVRCYPNCDWSFVAPILNPNDFACFLNSFASGESYANCDGSTVPPVLNANDFQCFLNAYAAGCT